MHTTVKRPIGKWKPLIEAVTCSPPEGYVILSQIAVTSWEEWTFIFMCTRNNACTRVFVVVVLICLFVCFQLISDPADYLT